MCLVVVYAAAVYLGFVERRVDLGWMYDNYVPLLTGSCALSVTLTIYLYISSFKRGALLAAGAPAAPTTLGQQPPTRAEKARRLTC
jgi:hypothetical protein